MQKELKVNATQIRSVDNVISLLFEITRFEYDTKRFYFDTSKNKIQDTIDACVRQLKKDADKNIKATAVCPVQINFVSKVNGKEMNCSCSLINARRYKKNLKKKLDEFPIGEVECTIDCVVAVSGIMLAFPIEIKCVVNDKSKELNSEVINNLVEKYSISKKARFKSWRKKCQF